jgi:hypothetical protein
MGCTARGAYPEHRAAPVAVPAPAVSRTGGGTSSGVRVDLNMRTACTNKTGNGTFPPEAKGSWSKDYNERSSVLCRRLGQAVQSRVAGV